MLTNFVGMDFIMDKICLLVCKWFFLIECFVDVKMMDGYMFCVFCIGFIKRRMD